MVVVLHVAILAVLTSYPVSASRGFPDSGTMLAWRCNGPVGSVWMCQFLSMITVFAFYLLHSKQILQPVNLLAKLERISLRNQGLRYHVAFANQKTSFDLYKLDLDSGPRKLPQIS